MALPLTPHFRLTVGLLCGAEKTMGCCLLGLMLGVGVGMDHDLLYKDRCYLSGMKYIPRQGLTPWKVGCRYGTV